jgi:Na+-transporting NADH:ubiquinone oxidoreductase subunit NqrD
MKTRILLFLACFFLVSGFGIALAQAELETDEPFAVLPVVIVTLVTALAPFIVQLVSRLIPNELLRYVVSNIISAVIAFAAMLLAGLKPVANPAWISVFMLWSSTIYKMIWKPKVFEKNGSKMRVLQKT